MTVTRSSEVLCARTYYLGTAVSIFGISMTCNSRAKGGPITSSRFPAKGYVHGSRSNGRAIMGVCKVSGMCARQASALQMIVSGDTSTKGLSGFFIDDDADFRAIKMSWLLLSRKRSRLVIEINIGPQGIMALVQDGYGLAPATIIQQTRRETYAKNHEIEDTMLDEWLTALVILAWAH